MHLRASAILLSVLRHGEHGAIVRALTREAGVQAGYVRGGYSRAMRPVLQPGNLILGMWRARTDTQLPQLAAELIHSRAELHGEPLAAVALDWASALTATALPEGQPYPHIHAALEALLDALEAAPAARGWAVALVRYEVLMLAELGFGLDLSRCAVTGTDEALTWVSPKSGVAVSRAGARGYEAKLLPLPAFVLEGGEAAWPAILDGLALSGHFLARDLLADRRAHVLDARERLVDRLRRAVA